MKVNLNPPAYQPECLIGLSNEAGPGTCTLFAYPAEEAGDFVALAKQESEWAGARITFSKAEFAAAQDKARFLNDLAAECALRVPGGAGLFWDFSPDLRKAIAKIQSS